MARDSTRTYIDSAGIGMLAGCHMEMKKAGGQIRLAAAQGPTERTFHIIHMELIMAVDATVEIAQQALA